MAASETGLFEVMEVEEGDDDDLMLFAEDQSDRDISLDIDLNRNDHLQPKNASAAKRRSLASRIEVVVRKRPMNSEEHRRRESDIAVVSSEENKVTICEPRLKVDLTKFTQYHHFTFDHCFDERSTNEQIYDVSVKPLFATILQRGSQSKFAGKATCFGYGQTGSGKTYTLLGSRNEETGAFSEGLYAMAVRDLFRLKPPDNRILVSFYEIYGGKLFDLLNGRKQILCREDGKQKVNIIGLRRIHCEDPQSLMAVIAEGNLIRQTGSTGANNASSRSHAILSMDILPIRGRISFIDLAGSERGADTQHNDKQTRIEGAEINKSLLALKECIRALDMNSIHKPFRGSKLTQVLKESFMGNSRTLMVANISPNSGSCENTLNTLRYADRVKELKNGAAARSLSRNRSAPNLNEKAIYRPGSARRRKNGDKTAAARNVQRKKVHSVSKFAASHQKNKGSLRTRNANPAQSAKKRARSPASPNSRRPLRSSTKKRSRTPPQSKSPRSAKLKPLPPKENRTEHQFRGRAEPKGHRPETEQNESRKPEVEPNEEAAAEEQRKDDEPVLNSSFSKKQLIKAHRRHIDEFMLLIKEDMQLLKCFDKDEFTDTEYQQKLKHVLDAQEKAVQRYKRKVFNH